MKSASCVRGQRAFPVRSGPVAARREGERTPLAVAAADAPDLVALGRKRLADALQAGYQNMFAPKQIACSSGELHNTAAK